MRKKKDGLPNLSRAEACILSLALRRPAEKVYGLRLVKDSGGVLKRGGIYVTLDRMEEKGYVESEVEESTGGERRRPRRLYWVTGYGLRVYEAARARACQTFGLDGGAVTA